jgi:hypothetical protein
MSLSSRAASTCLLTAAVLGLAACGGETRASDGSSWQAQVDTLGDTIVVRTISGSERGEMALVPELRIGAVEGADHEMFGEITGLAVGPSGRIYVYDRLVPALRSYDADGRYLGTIGRQGGGPGEYANSDGGLGVLADGRLLLRDPGNARMTVYSADGAYLESLPISGTTFTSFPLFTTADGGFYNPVFGGGQPMRLARHAPDGTPGDTLPLPDRGVTAPQIRAENAGSSQSWRVPFTASAIWTFHPGGGYVSAVTDRYAIDVERGDGTVLRMEREADPVPVSPAERAAREEAATRAMRNLEPGWRWNGPPIPATKPLLSGVFAGTDRRIWAQLHQPGVRVADEGRGPGPDGRAPVPQFREPAVFDVFEADGRYLGRVSAPEDLQAYPRPVFGPDHVWATVRDDLGVQYLVRYRIAAAGEGAAR